MDACAFCRVAIEREYFRVGSVIACPTCVEKERVKDVATKGRYLRRGLLYASGAAIVASLVLWGIDELSSLGGGGGGLFSGGALLRGIAIIFAGRLIGVVARDGAKRRGSKTLQISAFVLTYLAYAMSFVWLVLERAPSGSLSVSRVLTFVLMGPILPWMMIIKNPVGISGIIVVTMACFSAWNATEKHDLVSGPFDSSDRMSEKPMFKSLG